MSGIYNAGSTAVELITVCCLPFVPSVSNSDKLRGTEPGLTEVSHQSSGFISVGSLYLLPWLASNPAELAGLS